MKGFAYVLAISSVLAAALPAVADDDHSSQGPRKQVRRGRQSDLSRLISGFKKHHDDKPEPKKDPIPIDPGRGDGRVPVNPVPRTPPVVRDHREGATSADGNFVFVNGHWERVKAPKVVRPRAPYPAGTVVRDHRTEPVIRDHRSEPVIRDHRTTPVIRDHRTDASQASGGTIVTVTNNSKPGPIIRDHRTQPVVRDHRSAK